MSGEFLYYVEFQTMISDRVSHCCLTPTQKFFSYIMARTG